MTSFRHLSLVFLLFTFLSQNVKSQKINGVCFVSPKQKTNFSNFNSFQRINAKWIALTPYAFSRTEDSSVKFNYEHSWWGEQSSGTIVMLKQAKLEGLKIMLKPHVWVLGEGWCGKFDLKTEEQWIEWEKDYAKYILTYAKIAAQYNVEILCIGTEYKIASTKRVPFWRGLIKAVRKIYKGKITYAANWDNYTNIKFWNDLDYIGIDAYFPLSKTKNAEINALNTQWKKVTKQLQTFSEKHNKKILFTEFGYKSIHFSAWNHWEIEHIKRDENVNIRAQENAYKALFQNVWNQPWFSGGFLWKWYSEDEVSGGLKNSDYTPQHKPVEKIIKQYYSH